MDIIVNIAVIITPIVIGVGFIFAYRQWKATSNTRMAQVILEISARWDTKELQESRQMVNKCANRLRECIEQADAENTQDLYKLVAIGNFFDSIGVLVMEGALSLSVAYDLFGEPVNYYYNIYKPILEDRKTKSYYKYFSQLHKAFQKEQAGRSTVTPRRLA